MDAINVKENSPMIELLVATALVEVAAALHVIDELRTRSAVLVRLSKLGD